jgi:hypothetical protein
VSLVFISQHLLEDYRVIDYESVEINALEEAVDDTITLVLFVSGQLQTRKNNIRKQQSSDDTIKLLRLLLVAPVFATGVHGRPPRLATY